MTEGTMSDEEKAIEQKHIRKFFDIIDNRVTWDLAKPSFVAVFEEVFTDTEITEILRFYMSPAGKAFNGKFPVLSLRLIQAGQRIYGSVLLDLEPQSKQIDEDIKKEIAEFRAKHKN